jgi:hypothetical protein
MRSRGHNRSYLVSRFSARRFASWARAPLFSCLGAGDVEKGRERLQPSIAMLCCNRNWGMIMKKLILGALCIGLAGCQTTPAKYAAALPQDDPKWNSADCKAIRLKALDYDDKVGGRMAIGVGAGLLLGPFGIPLAAAADANQNEIRKAWDREVHLACSSKPLPESLKDKPQKPRQDTAQ